MTESPDNVPNPIKTRPDYVFWLVTIGALISFAAYMVRTLWPGVDPDQLAATQSILASMGVAFVSAGVLTWLGPKFRMEVKADVETAVGQATATVASNVRREVDEEVAKKFDSMREEIYASLQSRMDEQDSVVADFRDSLSRKSARRAMECLSEIGALEDDKLTVQAGEHPGSLSVFLSLQYVSDEPGYGEPLYTTVADYSLCLGADTGEKESFVVWAPSKTYADVVQDLAYEIQATADVGLAQFQSYDWDAIGKRLATNLQVALDSRRKNPGKIHLAGPLSEVVGINEPWYITANSLECPSHGFRALASEFPPRQVGMHGNGVIFPDAVPQPEFAEGDEWKYVLAVATDKFSPLRVGSRY
ncbi:hypothetical protein HTS88_18165 [Pseudarthrobacter oxydans]|uniref:hypothetical protein n=1 Tax=Pseudarthrobacter oxydans TaxID=1671 RepID=UPI0015718BD9|nr:hypothetical protein [Pseudarthrobacter oxydans]NSX38312.1 hypothetical protein [Pseudarthrobacter oxydans]